MKKNSYIYLPLLYALYMTVDLLSMGFTYKFVQIGYFFVAAETLVFPITYTIADITAEVYGYAEARKMIWIVFLCNSLFSLGALLLAMLPSPDSSQQEIYNYVFKSLSRGTIAEVLGVQLGAFVNIYVICRFKILLKGKYFGLRCIASSAVGQAVLVVVAMPILFLGLVSMPELYKIMLYSYLYKLVYVVFMAFPASISASILKRKEGVDVYDYAVDYNPFAVFKKKKSALITTRLKNE